MKVLAKASRTYLVEATEDELAQIAGHAYLSRAPFAKASDSYQREWRIPIGTELVVSERFQRLADLERSREASVQAAKTLRGLAALVEQTLPAGLVPPKPEEPEQ